MNSTWNRAETIPPYLGADLTDRYSGGNAPRAIDVCGLVPDEKHLHARFWTWGWDPGCEVLDVTEIAREIRNARWTIIDGPQALAAVGSTMRVCERICGAAGQTNCDWKSIERSKCLHKPFAGFVLSSLELFRDLKAEGLEISLPGFKAPPGATGFVAEFYPGDLWNKRIVTPTFERIDKSKVVLRRKVSPEGKAARERILCALGVVFQEGDSLTDDQLDACLGAVLGAVADGKVEGVSIGSIGEALTGPDGRGYLREGPMAILEIESESLAREIQESIKSEWLIGVNSPKPSRSHQPAICTGGPSPTKKVTGVLPRFQGGNPCDRARVLQERLIEYASRGEPTLCRYWTAYQYIFQNDGCPFSFAYAQKAIRAAIQTPVMSIDGLSGIRLDGFMVDRRGKPGVGHWAGAPYDDEEWGRAFNGARVLKPQFPWTNLLEEPPSADDQGS